MSASYGLFASELQFTGNIRPDIFEQMVVAAAGRQIAGAWNVRLAAGAIVDGMLSHDGRDHDVGTGWLVSASGGRKWSFGPSQRFFATATLTLAYSSTSTVETGATDEVSLTAGDARVGALLGVTLADRFAPYVLARGFGGPVSWQVDGQDIGGSDQHHYQLGVGASVRLPMDASALIDASFVGERSLSVGLSLAL